MIGALAVTMLLTISPKFKQHPPLGFRYPRREGVLSLVLFSGLLLLAILIFSGYVSVANPLPQDSPAALEKLYQHGAVALLGAIIFGAALAYRRQPVRSAGWNRPLFSPSLQVGFAVIILTIFLHGKFSTLLSGVSTDQGIALLILLLLGLAEESIFRGYIQMRLSSWIGKTPGWLATAGLYTIWQLPRLIGTLPTSQLLLELGLAFLQGLLLGWMMQKCRHVLAPALYRAISGWIFFLN
jgi:membrane protease YdiL (CAAX protease family)